MDSFMNISGNAALFHDSISSDLMARVAEWGGIIDTTAFARTIPYHLALVALAFFLSFFFCDGVVDES